MTFSGPAHAFDVLQHHRCLYYAFGLPVWSDLQFDKAEQMVRQKWPWLPCLGDVGSSRLEDYPEYIQRGEWPHKWERKERDRLLAQAQRTWEAKQDRELLGELF
jgi:hypothetical protein